MKLIILKENDWYVVQCLEYDIASQGRTIPEALYDFADTWLAEEALQKEVNDSTIEEILSLRQSSV